MSFVCISGYGRADKAEVFGHEARRLCVCVRACVRVCQRVGTYLSPACRQHLWTSLLVVEGHLPGMQVVVSRLSLAYLAAKISYEYQKPRICTGLWLLAPMSGQSRFFWQRQLDATDALNPKPPKPQAPDPKAPSDKFSP